METHKKTFDLKAIDKHIINNKISIRQVLSKLDTLASDAILFLVDDDEKILGSLTDGDIRRGFIQGLSLEDKVGLSQVSQDITFLLTGKGYRIYPNYKFTMSYWN